MSSLIYLFNNLIVLTDDVEKLSSYAEYGISYHFIWFTGYNIIATEGVSTETINQYTQEQENCNSSPCLNEGSP
jgi:predicted nuclease of predicted toxin-antitoxin system